LPLPLTTDRRLPGIDLNEKEQLEFLNNFTFAHELAGVPQHKVDEASFYMENGAFGSGDAEYWYQLIRYKKPKLIIEIGD